MKQIFSQLFTAPHGAPLPYHRLEAIEIEAGVALAKVSSFQDAKLDRIAWQDRYEAPLSALSATPEESVVAWLISPVGPFAGGSVIDPDAAVLDQVKAIARSRIKARQDQAEWQGVETPSGVVDSDPKAQRRILGQAFRATTEGDQFSIPFRLHDNTIPTLNGSEMLAISTAVARHVAACQARKDDLDAAVDAAADVDAIAAINIDDGWPLPPGSEPDPTQIPVALPLEGPTP